MLRIGLDIDETKTEDLNQLHDETSGKNDENEREQQENQSTKHENDNANGATESDGEPRGKTVEGEERKAERNEGIRGKRGNKASVCVTYIRDELLDLIRNRPVLPTGNYESKCGGNALGNDHGPSYAELDGAPTERADHDTEIRNCGKHKKERNGG